MLDNIDFKFRKDSSEQLHQNDTNLSKNNPLAGYLKIFHNQHRLIFLLYRGLVIIFAVFLILNSIFIYNMWAQNMISKAGLFGLALVDLVLFAGLYRVLKHFHWFKSRSQKSLEAIDHYLQKDLSKLEKIKSEHHHISDTHSKLRHRIEELKGKRLFPAVKDYKGWDKKTCPRCGSYMEMSEAECPFCKTKLNKPYVN